MSTCQYTLQCFTTTLLFLLHSHDQVTNHHNVLMLLNHSHLILHLENDNTHLRINIFIYHLQIIQYLLKSYVTDMYPEKQKPNCGMAVF